MGVVADNHSGLSDLTTYYFRIDQGRGVVTEYSVTTSRYTTYRDLCNLINSAISPSYSAVLVGSFGNQDIRIYDNTRRGYTGFCTLLQGTTSPDMFSTLTDWSSFNKSTVYGYYRGIDHLIMLFSMRPPTGASRTKLAGIFPFQIGYVYNAAYRPIRAFTLGGGIFALNYIIAKITPPTKITISGTGAPYGLIKEYIYVRTGPLMGTDQGVLSGTLTGILNKNFIAPTPTMGTNQGKLSGAATTILEAYTEDYYDYAFYDYAYYEEVPT
jgi:hypothetical protein